MQNTIGSKLVEIAALRVEALRRLIALAPDDQSCGPIRAQLAEAEHLLRYRLKKFSIGRQVVAPNEEPASGRRAANP